ncbi:Lactose operon repressor [Anaerolineae bacterium]|nr:Lactose operon repressor [Anaerolineae bacterium]
MKAKRPTVRDVAREAGVSHQTVSRVINNDPHVAAVTRNRVLKAIELLDFRPNRAAQIMQTERSHTIEVVMPYYGFNRVLQDMAYAARQLGYHFIISTIGLEDFAETLQSARSRFIDGLVLIPLSPIIGSYEECLRLTDQVPFVQIGAPLGAYLPSVIYDQGQGSRLATQHLIDLGHREIAEISGPLNNFDGRARHESWLATLRENQLEPVMSVEGDFTIESGLASMNQLLDSGAKFTAVVVGNDVMAYSAHTALRMRGLCVPEDVSIVGFDNLTESAHFMGGLTTVHQDFSLMGRLAIEYIVGLIENPQTPVYQRVLSPKLVVRSTTCPPR